MKKVSIPPFVHCFPAPAVVIGCGTVSKPNLITCSWFGTICSDPPMVSLSVRRSRFSHHLIAEHQEFTVNLPRVPELEMVKYCGVKSGRDRNKFTDLKLTAVPCPPLQHAPMIEEFFCTLACRIEQTLELGSHDMFVARVMNVYCREEDRRQVRPNPRPEEQIAYLDGKYWRLVEVKP